MVEDLGFDLVDLNLGCPAKKVVKCNGGSGLLRDLPLIRQIFEAVRAAVKIPFTVKFRAGWNDDEIVCVELARMAEAAAWRGRAARPHSRARLQRKRALGMDRRRQACGEDSRDRQWRHPLARRRLRHGRPNRLRRRDDRPHGPVESVDLPPDRAVCKWSDGKCGFNASLPRSPRSTYPQGVWHRRA
jgi:hypothetical protein